MKSAVRMSNGVRVCADDGLSGTKRRPMRVLGPIRVLDNGWNR